nr:cellulase family glycosylhydrolase [Gemmatimonadales bacterium]
MAVHDYTAEGKPAAWNHPRNLDEWADYCAGVAQHYRDRGDPVETWYFSIWNEPNNYGSSGSWSTSEFFDLYDAAAAALRSVEPNIKVGGPSTDGNPSSWIQPLLYDGHDIQFITWHRYGAWDPGLSKPDSEYMAETLHYRGAASDVESWIDTYRPGE